MTRLLAVLVLALSALAAPVPARCAWCMGNPCYSRQQCGHGCTCLRSGLDPGQCVSLSREP